MISYLKGILINTSTSSVVIEVHGIGYTLFVSSRLLADLPPVGQQLLLHTAFVVRESSQTLYGFLSHQERDVFELLLNVTGIGPKMALSLIGHLTLAELSAAVRDKDLTTLCRAPGVGKKTAERLIMELKDKILSFLPLHSSSLALPMHQGAEQQIQDAMRALLNLGYNQNSVQKAIKLSLKELPETAGIELLITTALKNI